MTFSELQKNTEYLKPVCILEHTISHRKRVWIKRVLLLVALILLFLSSGIVMHPDAKLTGIFFLVSALFLICVALDALYYSFVYDDDAIEPNMYPLVEILFNTHEEDLVGGFFRSKTGRMILLRLGLETSTLREYFEKRSIKISSSNVVFPRSDTLFHSYLTALYSADTAFMQLLISHSVDEQTFVQCALWVTDRQSQANHLNRWWSRERLESIPTLGRDWAYGKAYTLMRLSSPLQFSHFQDSELHNSAIDQAEIYLTRSAEANVLIVGDEGVGKMEVIEGLARRALRRKATKELTDKQYLVLDNEAFEAVSRDKISFEETLTTICNEASRAGNIVLIIPNISMILRLGNSVGSDVVSLLSRFLTSSSIQLIAVSDTRDFHAFVESNTELLKHFEKIQVSVGDDKGIFENLEQEMYRLESDHGVVVSYPAMMKAIQSAKQYFLDSPLLDSAIDLLTEAAIAVHNENRMIVEVEDIVKQISTKTGIKSGSIDSKERDQLQNLETLLHERVVGQDEAIETISNAFRRSRAGLNTATRPLGSFLFLGPSGVGKTETAKALSEIFFGHTAVMLRLDMTEYSGDDSLKRLIGTGNIEEPGILSSMVRDHQYGVLLLDEFEKTHTTVHDLFLQILDEGFFTDGLGRKVNARNLIIVATSNAGSQRIVQILNQGTDLASKKQEIIDSLISDGIFKPELLNRFDGIILFHPLAEIHLKGVAKIMLDRLAWKLKDRGITLVISDVLINFVSTAGKDIQFGARPLNRIIQDVVEKKIVDGLISGIYKVGSTIEFKAGDLK